MRILYLGYALPESYGKNNRAFSFAGNKFELGTLESLSSEYEVFSLSIPAIEPFPSDRRLFIKREENVLRSGLKTICVSTLNIPVLKQLWQSCAMYREATRLIRSTGGELEIITYNLYPQVGCAAMRLKRRFHKRVIAVVADLPFDDASERGLISRCLISVYNRITRKNLKRADGYILLNERAREYISDDAPYTVIEGAVDASEWSEKQSVSVRRDIIYSGALTEYSGISQLLEAMKLVRHGGIILKVFGDGYLKDEVMRFVQENDNVKYCGCVQNAEMRRLQAQALLLINPRPVDSNIAKYTFPSKLLEYMASGTPVMTSRLNGIRAEYDRYLSYIELVDPVGIAAAIDAFLDSNYDVQLEKAAQGREFVLQSKSWTEQGKKLVAFVRNILEKR